VGYSQVKGRKPFERASKIAHTEILNNPEVQAFVSTCTLPSAPETRQLDHWQKPLPDVPSRIRSVIAVDGGMTEAPVRKEFPSASIAFMTFGPLLLDLKDLRDLDRRPFIGPEDMARLKNLTRYSLPVPAKGIRARGASSFREGVRRAIHEFLTRKHPELGEALAWLLFRRWMPEGVPVTWVVPRCPSTPCSATEIAFTYDGPREVGCPKCHQAVFLADAMRLYERIDDEQGAGGIMSYLLTTLEQLVLVHIIRTVLKVKPALLREVLLVKDGPLAFFGVVAPLSRPMQELMAYLSDKDNGNPLICLVGLEKSGAFVEHAALIEPILKLDHFLMLGNDYIFKYIQPGDATGSAFGHNTYYGAKVIFKSNRGDLYVATIPTTAPSRNPEMSNLLNGPEVLRVTAQLRCSMYDHALVPVVLANRLVSLADVPSSEILARFARTSVGHG
jgi:hypothetical protein